MTTPDAGCVYGVAGMAYGVMVLVWQHGHTSGRQTWVVPVRLVPGSAK